MYNWPTNSTEQRPSAEISVSHQLPPSVPKTVRTISTETFEPCCTNPIKPSGSINIAKQTLSNMQ